MRTRTVDTDREREQAVDEYASDGYRVVHDGDTQTKVRKRDHGGWVGHLVLFIIAGWWTLGLANIIYALYRRIVSKDSVMVRTAE